MCVKCRCEVDAIEAKEIVEDDDGVDEVELWLSKCGGSSSEYRTTFCCCVYRSPEGAHLWLRPHFCRSKVRFLIMAIYHRRRTEDTQHTNQHQAAYLNDVVVFVSILFPNSP